MEEGGSHSESSYSGGVWAWEGQVLGVGREVLRRVSAAGCVSACAAVTCGCSSVVRVGAKLFPLVVVGGDEVG